MKLPAAYLQAEEDPLRTEMLQPEPTGCRRQGSAGPVQKGAHQKRASPDYPQVQREHLAGKSQFSLWQWWFSRKVVSNSFSTPRDSSLEDSSVQWDSPGKNTGVGCHTLLQGIFLTQESNLCFLHCR